MSKEMLEKLRSWIVSPDDFEGIASLIETQQKRIDELERRLKSEERLSFRHQLEESQAREALKQKRLDELESEIDRKMSAASYVIEQLAASQAQIKVMRDALETCEWVDSINGGEYIYDEPLVKAALSQPADDSALREIKAGYEAQLNAMREALENCRLIAARYRKEEWAQHTLRICAEAGVTGSPLRQEDDTTALRELLRAERERVAKVVRNASFKIQSGSPHRKIFDAVVAEIRAMEDQ